jgi:hypothetical protein
MAGTWPDIMLFYFVTASDAQAFIDRFSCAASITDEWRDKPTPRRERERAKLEQFGRASLAVAAAGVVATIAAIEGAILLLR